MPGTVGWFEQPGRACCATLAIPEFRATASSGAVRAFSNCEGIGKDPAAISRTAELCLQPRLR